MYTLYLHILRNNGGNIYALISDKYKSELNVVGGIRLTAYMPILPHDIIKFIHKISKVVVDAFKETITSKTEFFFVDVCRNKSRVFTFLEFETDKPHPFDKIGELVLELPILKWEVLFALLDETRDFFQENLC